MGRGRRPNLALEPTRALQTQRAFRQRKAEHLASLEESVKQLSEENAKLRKLLDSSPVKSLISHSPSRSASPSTLTTTPSHGSGVAIVPTRGAATPGSNDSTANGTCESCAPIHEANRQLAMATAQVEAQMRVLQQSIKALRSVLVHHGIPIPSPLAGVTPDLVAEESRHPKRLRLEDPHPQLPPLSEADPSTTPGGIHMTSSYFTAPSYNERRLTHPSAVASASVMAACHTPSPSAIFSAPTPPSASFSPRHSYNGYVASPASTSANIAGEEAYYKRHPTRRNSGSNSSNNSNSRPPQLPHTLSPARQSTHLPPWSTSSSGPSNLASPATLYRQPATSVAHSYHNSETKEMTSRYPQSQSVSTPSSFSSEQRYALPPEYPPHARVRNYPSAGSPSVPPAGGITSPCFAGSSYDHPSPRLRMVQSPRDDESSTRPVVSNYTPRRSTVSTERASKCGEKEALTKSCCNDTVESTNSSNCPPTNKCAPPPPPPPAPSSQTKSQDKWEAPPPLGVSFDMRLSTKPIVSDDAPSRKDPVLNNNDDDDECCLGLVKCDSEGRIII